MEDQSMQPSYLFEEVGFKSLLIETPYFTIRMPSNINAAASVTTTSPPRSSPPAQDLTATIAPDLHPDEIIASSSTSVTDSVLQFRIENGRTYHKYKDGKYSYPNDERENERLDVQHNMFLLSFDNQLGTAPLNKKDANFKAKRVLDVGTGTGIWAIEFGDEHPDSEVAYGSLSSTPPNVKFEIDDVNEIWTYSRPFDYIHSRMMTSSIGDWKAYLQKCYEDLITILSDIGFVEIHAQTFKWHSNPWPRDKKHKELGYWNYENSIAGLEGFMMAPFTRVHNWTKEEVTVFAMEVRNEMKDPKIHSYSNM
ncbi:hypothetical protein CSAL01_01746 [Colletotrichum salicis]|uniref:Methyltransferase n=1 Tax=Colletotrichum salicis TaxID=1209931 RepID=A0A135V6N4_9PEZI|nr:hypothetical protein CSAL01_01746 [Colletotrichum salicis]